MADLGAIGVVFFLIGFPVTLFGAFAFLSGYAHSNFSLGIIIVGIVFIAIGGIVAKIED